MSSASIETNLLCKEYSTSSFQGIQTSKFHRYRLEPPVLSGTIHPMENSSSSIWRDLRNTYSSELTNEWLQSSDEEDVENDDNSDENSYSSEDNNSISVESFGNGHKESSYNKNSSILHMGQEDSFDGNPFDIENDDDNHTKSNYSYYSKNMNKSTTTQRDDTQNRTISLLSTTSLPSCIHEVEDEDDESHTQNQEAQKYVSNSKSNHGTTEEALIAFHYKSLCQEYDTLSTELEILQKQSQLRKTEKNQYQTIFTAKELEFEQYQNYLDDLQTQLESLELELWNLPSSGDGHQPQRPRSLLPNARRSQHSNASQHHSLSSFFSSSSSSNLRSHHPLGKDLQAAWKALDVVVSELDSLRTEHEGMLLQLHESPSPIVSQEDIQNQIDLMYRQDQINRLETQLKHYQRQIQDLKRQQKQQREQHQENTFISDRHSSTADPVVGNWILYDDKDQSYSTFLTDDLSIPGDLGT